MVGGKVVPGCSTCDDVVSDLTSWSVIVLPDEFLTSGKLLYFSAFFVRTTPVYVQIWRPGNTSDQFMLVYYQKVFPQTPNKIETVRGGRPALTFRLLAFLNSASATPRVIFISVVGYCRMTFE